MLHDRSDFIGPLAITCSRPFDQFFSFHLQACVPRPSLNHSTIGSCKPPPYPIRAGGSSGSLGIEWAGGHIVHDKGVTSAYTTHTFTLREKGKKKRGEHMGEKGRRANRDWYKCMTKKTDSTDCNHRVRFRQKQGRWSLYCSESSPKTVANHSGPYPRLRPRSGALIPPVRGNDLPAHVQWPEIIDAPSREDASCRPEVPSPTTPITRSL